MNEVSATKVRSVGFPIPDETYYGQSNNPAHQRKIARTTTIPVSQADQDDYEQVKAAWDRVMDSRWFQDYGDWAGVVPPAPREEITYAETRDEWLARCRRENQPTHDPRNQIKAILDRTDTK